MIGDDGLLAVNQALGVAYGLNHAIGRSAAVEYLKKTIVEPEYRAAASARRDELGRIVAARTVGENCGCYVSKTSFELLDEALNA